MKQEQLINNNPESPILHDEISTQHLEELLARGYEQSLNDNQCRDAKVVIDELLAKVRHGYI